MDRKTLTILLLAAGVASLMFCGGVVAVVSAAGGSGSEVIGPRGGANRIGVLEVKGVIGSADELLKSLKKFREDDDIKAILVRVNSPGGAVAPSQELHDAIARAVKLKPVVISMGDVAASGGYYLAVSASKIYAEPGTLTGSIGVIAEIPEVDQLMQLAHVQLNIIKSGKFKDVGTPTRPPTDDDRKLLQGVIDDTYGQFVKAVADGRKLPVEKVRPYADGRVLTGQQAKAVGLIDELGGMEDAVEGTMALAKLTGKPTLVYPAEDLHFRLTDLLKESSQAFAEGLTSALLRAPRGVYFLMPGLSLR